MDGDWILVEECVEDFLEQYCDLCSTCLSVPFYTCKEEEEDRTRYVHKACADLPKEMEHELHRGHTLLQLDKVGKYYQLCNCCNGKGFPYYKCSDCQEEDFFLSIKCALKSIPITHKCHPQHPLVPIHDCFQECYCVACRRVRYGNTYKCTTCPSFQVHQDCVSSRILKLPLHCHELKLIHSLPAESHTRDQLIYCQTCEQDMKQGDFAYQCARCRYFFHSYNCRPMVHFSHPHPLNMVNEGANADPPASGNCYACGTKISVPYFYCIFEDCPGIFLHKYCAELPQNVEHHFHPDHALTLSDLKNTKCNACHVPCEGLSYSCTHPSCCFTIDTICATKTLHLKREFHQHPLFSSPIKATLACRACNLDSEGPTYQCTTCRFWVHQHCASVPVTITKSDLHPHKLILSYSLEDSLPEYHKDFHCHVCREEIKPHNWAYHCAGCKYFIHVHNCSDPNRDIEEFDLEAALAAAVHLPVPNECVSLATLFFMDTNHEEDKELKTEPEDGNGIKTRWHIPFLDPNETCDVCEGLLAAPCNNCALCKYFLPKSLSELRDPSLFEGFHKMLKDTTEENNCNGFGLTFHENDSIIKISCSVLPGYVKHEGHNHVLSTTYITKPSWCNACENEFEGYGFKCSFCDFTIDMYCALLPGSVSHKSDKEHPFKLTYYSIEDVEEYVCEICEEDITTMWFYHCVECDHSIHPECIWKICILFGPYVTVALQDGEMALVSATKSHPMKCAFCGQKEISGCRYFLNYGNNIFVHLKCYAGSKVERWPTEQEELRRVLAEFKS